MEFMSKFMHRPHQREKNYRYAKWLFPRTAGLGTGVGQGDNPVRCPGLVQDTSLPWAACLWIHVAGEQWQERSAGSTWSSTVFSFIHLTQCGSPNLHCAPTRPDLNPPNATAAVLQLGTECVLYRPFSGPPKNSHPVFGGKTGKWSFFVYTKHSEALVLSLPWIALALNSGRFSDQLKKTKASVEAISSLLSTCMIYMHVFFCFSPKLHAEYCREKDGYLPHRVVQAWELAQFIQWV